MINKSAKSNELIINIKSFSANILKYYLASFFYIIKSKKIRFKMQPIKYKRLTVLRSPHKYKRAQEHFELKVYKNTLIVEDINISELLVLLTNKPQGVFINLRFKEISNQQ